MGPIWSPKPSTRSLSGTYLWIRFFIAVAWPPLSSPSNPSDDSLSPHGRPNAPAGPSKGAGKPPRQSPRSLRRQVGRRRNTLDYTKATPETLQTISRSRQHPGEIPTTTTRPPQIIPRPPPYHLIPPGIFTPGYHQTTSRSSWQLQGILAKGSVCKIPATKQPRRLHRESADEVQCIKIIFLL